MAKDGPRMIIKMESTAGTGFYYTTTKNRRNTQAKLELKKYDPGGQEACALQGEKSLNGAGPAACGPSRLVSPFFEVRS